MNRSEKLQTALRLMGNPYACLSLIDEEEAPVVEPSFQQKRAYFKKLENPQAFSEIFGDSEDNLWHAASKRKQNAHSTALENALDEVLLQYKPYVARNEWTNLMEFKPIFIKLASETVETAASVVNRLQKYKLTLTEGEKVEHNRAPAARIINELKKIIG